MRIEIVPGDYSEIISVRAYADNGRLLYRHCAWKAKEAFHRAEIERLFGEARA